MKNLLKVITYVTISLLISEYVIGCFDFEGEYLHGMFLLITAFSLLYFFLKPILVIIGLPNKGFGFTFLTFSMTILVLYVLTIFVADFYIRPTTLSGLNILGFVLPSKRLTSFWASVFSALVISLVYTYFDWLSSKKK